ncbi:hypothetical protein XarbCFBP8138_10860 [Xanthomonas arboricola]|nr:hypothetical protein XarbCFBP8138_10860 [Xanthomonas arboricola]
MLRRNGRSVGLAQYVATEPGAASRRRRLKFKPTHRQILALAVERVPALGPGGRLAIGPGPSNVHCRIAQRIPPLSQMTPRHRR